MDIDNEGNIDRQPLSALDRARVVSQALADAARLARVSKRSRRALVGGGFQARAGARFARLAILVSFVLMVVVPSLSAAIYYAFIASDQYVAEAKFTVTGGAPPSPDSFGSFTGIPAIAIIQDTQIVTNYIGSRAAVEKLDQTIGLRNLYANPDADRLSRFNPSKPIEKFVRYWQGMAGVSISLPAGIVDLKVRAFTPQDAAKIASAVLDMSESLINDLNVRMNHDAVASAQLELDRTSDRLTKARLALETARNDTGLLDTTKTSDALNKLITDARSSLLQMQQQYTSELKYVSDSAPQMRALKSRIDAASGQIADLESKLTSTKATSPDEPTLAASMTKFSELDLENQVAQRLYAGAASALEIARLVAENKMMYLNTFVKPVVPQEPQYPRRFLYTLAIFIGSLAIWGACCGLALAIRNYKA
ncbi:MAG TPA: lipopolysaccharide biosynthesis protein [Beijerinckiaceae bacterium]|jgi:capsular polysaccharide transport system permease protein|nr:lipopolysaccharide biosynthesis protein [Beijerinckiaceae bacterium]